MGYRINSAELDRRFKKVFPCLSNQAQYVQRVLGSQRIQPIWPDPWHSVV